MGASLKTLMNKLGYSFNNEALLKQALTHRSKSQENYERFEFLGDSVLNFVIAEALFTRFPAYNEGQLSRMRAALVKEATIAEIAHVLTLGDYLFLGQGELKSGGFRRSSILADSLEAIFAAVYLDSGINACQALIIRLYQQRLNQAPSTDTLSTKDPKTLLQEYMQSQKQPLPVYSLTEVEGEEHAQIFHIRCKIPGIDKETVGCGDSRRKAEMLAAREMLDFFLRRSASK